MPLYDAAIKPYFDLLDDPMGVDMTRLDTEAAALNTPFGYYMFEKDVPERSLYAPVYKDDNGDTLPVTTQDVLFTGYKDLVLLFRAERDAARAAAKLARLYILRGADGDTDKANQLIGQAQQKYYTDGNILNGIFSENILSDIDENSGLTEARAGWAQALTELSGVKGFLDDEANPLGLDKDFLALVQTDIPGTGNNVHKDSFNYFADILIPDGSTPGGPLKTAKDKYDEAYAQYEKVKTNENSIRSELNSMRQQFGDRLRSITGAEYPDPPDPDSPYHTPEKNVGSEIYNQYQNIESARLVITLNNQQIENLEGEIYNEIERRGKIHGINNLIAQTDIKYGDKKAKLTEKIGYINADKEYTQNKASSVSKKKRKSIKKKSKRVAKLQAEQEKLSAEQSAEIQYLNDSIDATESETRVKNMYLTMHTLAIESLQAALTLEMEESKLQGLLDEKAYLEARWQEAKENLGTRYFADPSHRLIMNHYIVDADLSFQKAQLWLYIMARALDYKRNTRFVVTSGSEAYTSSSVFALRNAKELLDMAQAMWVYDQEEKIGDRQGTQFIKFSFREDFAGYKKLDENGEVVYYPDPETGEMVNSITAFRSYMKKPDIHVAPKSPALINYSEVLHLEFDTVKTNLEGTFFSPARWNEKIKWIAIKINAESDLSQLMVYLEQSGMGYIRNSTFGTAVPEHPDQIENEMTGYPIRYWFKKPNTDEWISKNVFGFGINAVITEDKNAPSESWQKKEFHEMPTAVSKWILEIPLKSVSGTKVLDVERITDIEIWFYNYYHGRNY